MVRDTAVAEWFRHGLDKAGRNPTLVRNQLAVPKVNGWLGEWPNPPSLQEGITAGSNQAPSTKQEKDMEGYGLGIEGDGYAIDLNPISI